MTAIQSLEDLEKFKQDVIDKQTRLSQAGLIQAVVSMGSCGIAAGAQRTYDAVLKQIEHVENISLSKTGCIGLCSDEPILQVITSDGQKTTYGHVTPDIAERIFREHIRDGKIVREYQIVI